MVEEFQGEAWLTESEVTKKLHLASSCTPFWQRVKYTWVLGTKYGASFNPTWELPGSIVRLCKGFRVAWTSGKPKSERWRGGHRNTVHPLTWGSYGLCKGPAGWLVHPNTHSSQLSAPARPRQHGATEDVSPSSCSILEGIGVSILGQGGGHGTKGEKPTTPCPQRPAGRLFWP